MSGQDNPFRATAGLRIEPAPAGSAVRLRLGIEPGALTDSGYPPPPPFGWSKWSTSAADFRNLIPLVLMTALRQAGTQVYEPIQRFSLDIPADTYGLVLPLLARPGAAPGVLPPRGASCLSRGTSRPPGCTGWSSNCPR